MSSSPNREWLKEKFGYEAFRGPQNDVLTTLMGGKSSLLLMPTGQGKSLCFQYPASLSKNLVLVITPLIALMEDQIKRALEYGISARCLHSAQGAKKRLQVLKDLAAQQVHLLFVTPERFLKEDFLQALHKNKVELFVVDEAHCISIWGQDFRPEYQTLGKIRTELGTPPFLATTATATPRVREDILSTLKSPGEEVAFFNAGLERKNLFIGVHETPGFEEKVELLVKDLQEGNSILVYFSLIGTMMKVASLLRGKVRRFGIYHGQLPDQDRHQNQSLFLEGKVPILLATPAFGLGVHKADIRKVLHFEMPRSIEDYYQEAGRAGRDDELAHAWLYYESDDLLKQMEFIKWSNPEGEFIRRVYNTLRDKWDRVKSEGVEFIREDVIFKNKKDFRLETTLNLLEHWGVVERDPKGRFLSLDEKWKAAEVKDADLKLKGQVQLQLLQKLVEFAGTDTCRKQFIYAYFGEDPGPPCGKCDNCS